MEVLILKWVIILLFIGLYLVAIFAKSHKPILIYCAVLGTIPVLFITAVGSVFGGLGTRFALAIGAFIAPFISAYIVHYLARGVVFLFHKATA